MASLMLYIKLEWKLRRSLRHKVRPQRLEMATIGDEVYYKKGKNDEWRRPRRMIGRDGKVVIVKQDGSLRGVTRVHITRLQGKPEAEVDE